MQASANHMFLQMILPILQHELESIYGAHSCMWDAEWTVSLKRVLSGIEMCLCFIGSVTHGLNAIIKESSIGFQV